MLDLLIAIDGARRHVSEALETAGTAPRGRRRAETGPAGPTRALGPRGRREAWWRPAALLQALARDS